MDDRDETDARDLDTPFPLPSDAVAAFARDGFVRLKRVLEPATLAHHGAAIDAAIDAGPARRAAHVKPMHERTTYEKAFLQVMNLWTTSAAVRRLVFSGRLARIAAELMQVAGVRLYHDQALYKAPGEAGGGATPWHADQYYWPLASDRCCTIWIPLQATPRAMGPVAFSVGSHLRDFGRALAISDESEARISKALLAARLPVHDAPFEPGEVSVHSGWTFHRAGANSTGETRRAMTVIYVDAAMRVAPPVNANQRLDLATWLPGLAPGDRAASPLNPEIPLAGRPSRAP
jgi:ectoine hydroxylase-related dioxygenase (phytanoyl-CoA dioxygenase family)